MENEPYPTWISKLFLHQHVPYAKIMRGLKKIKLCTKNKYTISFHFSMDFEVPSGNILNYMWISVPLDDLLRKGSGKSSDGAEMTRPSG